MLAIADLETFSEVDAIRAKSELRAEGVLGGSAFTAAGSPLEWYACSLPQPATVDQVKASCRLTFNEGCVSAAVLERCDDQALPDAFQG